MTSRWEWNKPEGHETQPLTEWWFEQVAVYILMKVAKRSRRRNDTQTFHRMSRIICAGAQAEKEA